MGLAPGRLDGISSRIVEEPVFLRLSGQLRFTLLVVGGVFWENAKSSHMAVALRGKVLADAIRRNMAVLAVRCWRHGCERRYLDGAAVGFRFGRTVHAGRWFIAVAGIHRRTSRQHLPYQGKTLDGRIEPLLGRFLGLQHELCLLQRITRGLRSGPGRRTCPGIRREPTRQRAD